MASGTFVVTYKRNLSECMDDYYNRIRPIIHSMYNDGVLENLTETSCEIESQGDEKIFFTFCGLPNPQTEDILMTVFSYKDLKIVYV